MRSICQMLGVFLRRLPYLAGLPVIAYPLAADAHVKWFAPFDVTTAPRALSGVLSADFWLLLGISVATFWTFLLIERTSAGGALLRAVDRPGAAIRARTDDIFRAGTATFFIALWALGGIILTPELKTDSEIIPWIQAAIAVGMFWRGTMILSALGICFLFAFGVMHYGPFHMTDYPIFLGAAGYLALSGLQRTLFGLRPLDVARWGASITLMWASVEKWAFPQWSYPLLEAHPSLALGFSPTFYMVAAGMVEFFLAFALLWTPLVRRLSSIVLLGMFTGAIVEFGRIDAIGHLMIIMMFIVFVADDGPSAIRRPLLAPISCCIALLASFGAYYGLHATIFRATVS